MLPPDSKDLDALWIRNSSDSDPVRQHPTLE